VSRDSGARVYVAVLMTIIGGGRVAYKLQSGDEGDDGHHDGAEQNSPPAKHLTW